MIKIIKAEGNRKGRGRQKWKSFVLLIGKDIKVPIGWLLCSVFIYLFGFLN